MIFHVKAVTVACLFACLLPEAAAHAQTRVVSNASVEFRTGADGKNDTTVLTVTVANAGGPILERVFSAGRKAPAETISTFWLNRIRSETADQLNGSHISFTILPKGDDRWVIKEVRLKVNFVTGPSRTWHLGPFTLDSHDSRPARVDFVLADDSR